MSPFPFPCNLDFSLFRMEISRNCIVLKRRDKQFPHITLYYQPRPDGKHRGCWCPHVTWLSGGRRRHEDLARWRPEEAREATERCRKALVPRFMSVLRPVTVEQLIDESWLLFAPNDAVVQAYVDALLEGRTFFFERLENIKENFLEGPIGRALEASIIHPLELVDAEPSAAIAALRIGNDGDKLESGMLHGFRVGERGAVSWHLAPMDFLGMTPEEMVHLTMPNLFEVMWKVADVLDLPIPSKLFAGPHSA